MFGRFFTNVSVAITLLIVIFGNLPARAADPSQFDPEKKFSILAGSAMMGDPAPYLNLGTGHEGGTVVTTVLNPQTGLIVMASLIEPGQNGQPGGGHGILLKPQEAALLINLLRKGPSWQKIARDNKVFEYSKTVGYLRGKEGDANSVSVVFVSNADQSMFMQLEHLIAGKSKKYRFNIDAGLKFSNQLLHFLASAGSEFAPDNPEGNADKDKLFN